MCLHKVHMNVPAMWSSQSATLTRRRWEMHLPHSAPGSAHCRRRPPWKGLNPSTEVGEGAHSSTKAPSRGMAAKGLICRLGLKVGLRGERCSAPSTKMNLRKMLEWQQPEYSAGGELTQALVTVCAFWYISTGLKYVEWDVKPCSIQSSSFCLGRNVRAYFHPNQNLLVDIVESDEWF